MARSEKTPGQYFCKFAWMRLKLLPVLFFAAVCSFGDSPKEDLSLPVEQMEKWVKVTTLTMALDYKGAMEEAKAFRAMNDGAGCVLENVVRISRYDDRGDTTALIQAGKLLEGCKADGLWEALRKFESGYVKTETGSGIKGAMTTRSAAKMFEESDDLEAKAFFAIYAYYVDQGLSWVPFKSDNRPEYLKTLDAASLKSERFWPLFLTPLVWMYYDKEDFATALKLVDRGLSKAPNHPVFLQMRADMLYRLKRYSEAAAIYEASAASYLKRTGPTIRYWCAVLNLVRIYHDAGNREKSQEWKSRLNSPTFKALEKWMPGSLMDGLKKKDLL